MALRTGAGAGVFAQLYSPAGLPVGGEFQVNTTITNDQADHTAAADARGNFLVAWASYGGDGDNNGVFAQRFSLCGNGALDCTEECDDGNRDDGDCCSASCRVESGCGGDEDHFVCHKARRTAGTAQLAPVVVSLADQFDSGPFVVRSPRELCIPADKNDEGISDPDTHLQAYRIGRAPGGPLHVPRTNVTIQNQLGTLLVDTRKPHSLLVPSAKDLTTLPPPPTASAHDVDHYKCYTIRVTPGTPGLPPGLQVTLADQFLSPPRLYDVKRPVLLCNPVDKNGEGIENPALHQVCYRVRLAPGHTLPAPHPGVFVNNQLGPLRRDVDHGSHPSTVLCVPSQKTL